MRGNEQVKNNFQVYLCICNIMLPIYLNRKKLSLKVWKKCLNPKGIVQKFSQLKKSKSSFPSSVSEIAFYLKYIQYNFLRALLLF